MGFRVFGLALLAVGSVWAQQDLFDLSTTGDGSTAWFATSLARKDSSDVVPRGSDLTRIFQADASGVQLYLERPLVLPEPVATRGQISFSNYYRLAHPQTSRDGKVVAITGGRYCTGGDFCASQATLQTTITGLARGTVDVAGAGRLSGNGRYLLIYSDGSLNPYGGVVDLQSGVLTPARVPGYNLGVGRVVADDGTVVAAQGSLWILRGDKVTDFPVHVGAAGQPVIDAAGQMVVYTTTDFYTDQGSIRSFRISDGADNLVAAMQGSASQPYLSADGTRVMFVSNASGLPQIYVVLIDGSGLRQVTREAGGVGAAAMSDDGKVAWYFSGAGRLYQVNLDTGVAQQRMGRTPQIGYSSRMAAGSVYTIYGWGLSDGTFAAAGYPLPRSLGGVSVAVNGVDAPLYSVSPTQIVLQVPWGTAVETNVEVKTSGSSIFQPSVSLANTTLAGYGRFLATPKHSPAYGGYDSLAVHQDWSALVTVDNPARQGEIVHLYGTGFGRPETPQADGVPAAGAVRTVTPVTCWAWLADNRTQLDFPVKFAGLAPGLAGYYQMDVQIPVGGLRPTTQLACTAEGNNNDFFGIVATATK